MEVEVTRASIENAVRAWLVKAGAVGDIPNADRAVIIADSDGPRPALPYLSVRVLAHDLAVGDDEIIVDDEDPPEVHGRGNRTSVVSVNAYGDGAETWLSRSHLLLGYPSIKAQLTAAGVAVRPIGGMNNLSALLDESTQVRFQRDFEVAYLRQASSTETEEATELELAEVEATYQPNLAGEFVDDISVDLT